MAEQAGRVQWSRLKPLQNLNHNDLEYLIEQSTVRELQPRTLISTEPDQIIYLLEGQVSLLAGGFVAESFRHDQPRALDPLFKESLDEDSAILTSAGKILEIDRALFEGLLAQQQVDSLSMQNLSIAEEYLFQILLKAFRNDELDLPVLPEVALRVRQALSKPDARSDEIISIVQTDPALSTRLIQVANSPLYGTWREIRNVRDAVRRLGLEATKNLSFSLLIKQNFQARSNVMKETIHRLYLESTAVAAIAFIIVEQQVPELDPDQALLGGLIMNLGLLPILKYIDQHPSIMQTVEQLGKSFDNLFLPVSKMILNAWNFDPEFVEIVEHGKDWQRDSGKQTDYCDVIIAARLLYLDDLGKSPVDRLDDLPVIRKLDLMAEDAQGRPFIERARDKIDDMQKMLHST